MRELADELLALGCTDAINLDGGSSSVMSVRMPGTSSCGIVNDPAAGLTGGLRRICSSSRTRCPTGRARTLGLVNDGLRCWPAHRSN
jgi:hypothetical protein